MNNINFQRTNKTKKVFACAVLVIALVALFTSCTPKTPVTVDFFKETVESLGYTTEDVTGQYEHENFKIIKGIALEEDCLYVAFFETDGNESANLAFTMAKAEMEADKGEVTAESSASIGDYQKYTLVAQGNYSLIERVGTTFVTASCHGPESQKVTDILDAIGY